MKVKMIKSQCLEELEKLVNEFTYNNSIEVKDIRIKMDFSVEQYVKTENGWVKYSHLAIITYI
jgi:hypothetical protein